MVADSWKAKVAWSTFVIDWPFPYTQPEYKVRREGEREERNKALNTKKSWNRCLALADGASCLVSIALCDVEWAENLLLIYCILYVRS